MILPIKDKDGVNKTVNITSNIFIPVYINYLLFVMDMF